MNARARADKIELALRLLRDACPSPTFQDVWDLQLETLAAFAVYKEIYGDEIVRCVTRYFDKRGSTGRGDV